MADDRYNRWQGLGIAQLSVAVALISGLSVAGLGVGLSLLLSESFLLCIPNRQLFAASLLLLFLAAFTSCVAVISRLLDFRLTARKVRKDTKPDYNKPLTIFWLGPDAYGRLTWVVFWASCISFAFGAVLLAFSVASAYGNRLF